MVAEHLAKPLTADNIGYCEKGTACANRDKSGVFMSGKKDSTEKQARQLTFHYIKSSSFRTVYVDGAIGSMTPAGNVHCAIYNERPAIPRTTRHILDENGQISEDGSVVDGRDGFVREMEADLVMSIETARALAKWLNEILESNDSDLKAKGTMQ